MGDAFTALADDEFTLFYNPAAMGRGADIAIHPLNGNLHLTNALDEMDRFEDFPKGDFDAISERFMGFPLYFNAGTTPTLKFGPFGLSLLAQSSMTMVLKNRVHPMLDVDYRYDRGFVAGFAFDFYGGGIAKLAQKKSSDKRLAAGFSVKHINRQGMENTFDLFGTSLIEIISSQESDPRVIRERLGYSKGDAWGFDAGLEYGKKIGESGQFTLATSFMDIGDTKFKKVEGDYDIPRQEMYWNAGAAFKQTFFLLDYSFSVDLHPINKPMDFGRKVHLGASLGIPLLSFYTGLNAGYLSYGVEIKLWPLKFVTGFYDVEVGATYKQEKAKRFLFFISLFDISFDA
jgi:hypothetical protein